MLEVIYPNVTKEDGVKWWVGSEKSTYFLKSVSYTCPKQPLLMTCIMHVQATQTWAFLSSQKQMLYCGICSYIQLENEKPNGRYSCGNTPLKFMTLIQWQSVVELDYFWNGSSLKTPERVLSSSITSLSWNFHPYITSSSHKKSKSFVKLMDLNSLFKARLSSPPRHYKKK